MSVGTGERDWPNQSDFRRSFLLRVFRFPRGDPRVLLLRRLGVAAISTAVGRKNLGLAITKRRKVT